MAITYRLRLLGTIQVEKEGMQLQGFESRKTLALLGYLVRQAQPVSRSHLAGLFWGNKPEARGRRNLSHELSLLSKRLPGCFEADYHTVHFQPTTAYWVDTTLFEELVKDSIELNPAEVSAGFSSFGEAGIAPDQLAEAVALYRGDFMAGYYLDDCPEFESWLTTEQEAWRQRMAEILERLIIHYIRRGQDEPAQVYTNRWLVMEPWCEEAHRYLMRLLARQGKRSAALAQYETCRRLLAETFEVAPDAETVALYEQIRAGALKIEEGRLSLPSSIIAPRSLALPTPPPPLPLCPYRGLFAFSENDAPFFFGRESLTARLIEVVSQESLVALIGPSGSGKSSLVFAGLLPHLRAQTGWLIADCRPGRRPFDRLAASLASFLEPHSSETDRLIQTRKLANGLRQDDLSLADIVRWALQKRPEATGFLLVIDHFEELYTLCPEPETRPRFLDVILGLSRNPGAQKLAADERSPITLVLTLRADFMGQALLYRPLAEALQKGQLLVGPMSRQELGRAIEKPTQQQGVAFETGLVERILADLGDEPGNLPLLEFALTALWQRQAAGTLLTHAAYEAIGRVKGALAGYADEVYHRLTEAEQAQVRQIFTQMVRPGEGTEDTRRLATHLEVDEAHWPLVQRLAEARLVVVGRDAEGYKTVEIIHEALIHGWERLRVWLEADRAFRLWQERLRVALRQWEENRLDEGVLLRGALLAQAEEWVKSRAAELQPLEQAFIRASVALRDERLVATEAQRQHELDQARRLAEAERQRAEAQVIASRRLRWLVIALGFLFILVVGATIFAVQ